MKGNVIQMNTLHLNSVRLNGIGKVQSVSLKGGSTEDPVFPPVEPPVEPEPTPTYTLSASVTNGKVSATRNGSAVNLPYTANEGDVIVVEVTPNDGYAFEGWADGNTDNPRSITMNADVALSAQCVEVVQPPVGNYIQFEDAEVERVLMSKGVSSDGVGITMEDAAKVTSISTWFKGNTAITSFEEFRYFTGVTALEASAFEGCSNLASLPIEHLVILNSKALYGCTALAYDYLNFQNLTTLGQDALYGVKIKKLNLGKVTTLPFARANSQNYGDKSVLEEVVLPETVTALPGNSFNGYQKITELNLEYINSISGSDAIVSMASLKKLIFGESLSSIYNYGIYANRALEVIIIKATTPPSLGTGNFGNTNNCPIYVPDASLEAYKTAVNWSAYADRIHPLSEIEGNNGVTLYDRLYGDGVAYIQTEYFLKGNETIESVAMNSYVDRNNKPLWGAYDGTRKTELLTGGDSQSSQIQWVIYYGSSSYVASAYLSTNNRPKVLYALTPSQFGFDGLYSSHSGSSIGINAPFCIFADYAEREYKWKGWIGSVIITDTGTSEVLAKFTPASYNGEAGMYDEISGKFYGNAAASGAFYVENE